MVMMTAAAGRDQVPRRRRGRAVVVPIVRRRLVTRTFARPDFLDGRLHPVPTGTLERW
jgi:hypothetical protein